MKNENLFMYIITLLI